MAKTVVNRKRTQLRKKRSDGIDPRILALGAGAGALVGGEIARGRNERKATRSVANDVARLVKNNQYNNTDAEKTVRAAKSVADSDYSSMRRVDSNKMKVYKQMKSERASQLNQMKQKEYKSYDKGLMKKAGFSGKDIAAYAAKSRAMDYSGPGGPEATSSIRRATEIRRSTTERGAVRRGRVAGALSAAAVATIVSQVLKELNKK